MLSKTCCCVESDSIWLINSPLKITIDNKNDNVYIKNNNQVLKMISITAVVHGGTIMAILSSLNKDEYYNYQCKNAEGYICRFII